MRGNIDVDSIPDFQKNTLADMALEITRACFEIPGMEERYLAADRCEDKVGNRRRGGNRLGIYVFYCHTITPYNSVTSACGMIAAFFRSSVMALISRMTRFVKERSAVTMPM